MKLSKASKTEVQTIMGKLLYELSSVADRHGAILSDQFDATKYRMTDAPAGKENLLVAVHALATKPGDLLSVVKELSEGGYYSVDGLHAIVGILDQDIVKDDGTVDWKNQDGIDGDAEVQQIDAMPQERLLEIMRTLKKDGVLSQSTFELDWLSELYRVSLYLNIFEPQTTEDTDVV